MAQQYYEIRSREISRLRETRSPWPYPHKFHITTTLAKFHETYAHLNPGDSKQDVEVTVGGRVYSKRASGAKLVFYDIKDGDTKLQIVCQAQESKSDFAAQHDRIHRGDMIAVVGYPGRSAPRNRPNDGERSVFAREVILAAPCLHQLPDTTGFFAKEMNVETRFRNRPLDFIMNDRARAVQKARAKIVRYIRRYFEDRDFDEFETPTLNQIAGGATAKPFMTFINEYKQNLFMRVAPELYLKELIVGGFPKVFELGKQFRNEGADLTHNPEFTTCEFYEAWADVYDVMETTEELISGLVENVTGGSHTTFNTQSGEEYKVDWSRPWKRIDMIPALEEATGEKFPPGEQLHTDETNAFLKGVLKKVNVECPPPLTNARILDKLVGEFIEEKCVNPTFITGHPKIMSPLAKDHRDKPGICERFEAFVCKKEIANAYTELNDPFEQRDRFEEQARQKDQGDEEAQLVDHDYIRALEYGLPPTGGWGLGIDRVVMFLTNNYSIREVVAFPYMKEDQKVAIAGELPSTKPAP